MAEKKGKESKYKKLFHEQKSAWETLEKKEIKQAFELSEDYKSFMAQNKSERETIEYFEKLAIKNGFVNINKATKNTKKIYAINHNTNILLLDLEKGKLSDGLNIIGSHIDVVKLDLKLNPVYESEPFAMLNLHYYGGIKKYQWLNLPMTLNGIIINKKGEKIKVSIGNKENEPVFIISDLLPHLEGSEYGEKKAKDIIKGEALDAIAASIPVDDKNTKEKIKATFLKAVNEKYGITEEDFVSADLSLYPAMKPRDVGIDKSMIGCSGNDDRVCSYTAIQALIDSKNEKASAVLLVDKEEIGSTGNTGMSSYFFENVLDKIAKLRKENLGGREILEKSIALSGDVTSSLDPKYSDKMDPYNLNKIGYGIAIEKGTGSGGKYGGSEANAELMSKIRILLNKNKVPWQYGEMGKVDEGGGGTIAYLLAKYNMEIVDAGPPVIAMHSPFEIISKVDLFCTYKAYKAFIESK
jgi:aspartyl aminopeptidase